MTKRTLISSILCLTLLTSALFAQSGKTAVPSQQTAAPQAISALATAPSLYNWQIRPNDMDGYFSSDIPQPVCGLEGGVAKIFIFTNFAYYPSKNFNNWANAIRVGVITTPADTYQLRSSNVAGDIHSLPGMRQEFAAASILRAGDQNHTIYLFGGKTPTGELDEVWSYTQATGFKLVTNIPARNGIPGARSGATALPSSNGKIYLFGGQQGGNKVLNQVLEFDPQANQFTPKVIPPMIQAFHGARGMTKAVGTNNYMYLVGARPVAYGAPTDRIYRFNVLTGATIEVKDANNPSQALTIPPGYGYPMVTWDPSGNVRVIASKTSGLWVWGSFEAWTLKDNYPPSVSDGKAVLSSAPYNDASRARDMAGAVKCGDATYLIGGTYGHGTSFQNRGMLVDKLAMLTYGPVKTIDIKTTQTAP